MSFFHHLFTPISNPLGSKLWLEADFGVTVNGSGEVQQVLDQSGNGRHMPVSTGAAQTILTPGAINGLPALTMTASRHNFSMGTELVGGFHMLVVAKFEATASSSYLVDSQVNANRVLFLSTSTVFQASAGAVFDVGLVDNNFNLHTFEFRGSGPRIGRYSKNGGNFTNYTFQQNYLVDFQIGQRWNTLTPFNGKLAAFIIETSETRALEAMAYLKYKYGR